ncbi:TetR/AcrR family transcriptional regulator [Lactobacillus xujianguonis]|uniref:TetR/AcrR family transcriptional regulator n=2 Tax=Lactobacillaceae TaxID=33958 RepID=A0A437SUW8_9LACO|nr:TetR/AcrR family transcriptional regulator [Lactobacillus xujianguonis]RVU73816.1 TetR/AcrR family transcriptional regulator [Lactobacillus xujianguonis]
MEKTPFIEVKVKDVIITSGISSRTFYQYYKDTRDLLLTVENEVLAAFKAALLKDRQAVGGIDHILTQPELVKVAENISVNTIKFLLKYKKQLEILTSDNGDIHFFNQLVAAANEEFTIRMEELNPHYREILAREQSLPPEMVLGIFDTNILSVALQLIRYNDELSPAEMRRYIAAYLTRTPFQYLGLAPLDQ